MRAQFVVSGLAMLIAACSAPVADDASSGDEELLRKAPIPFVMQYVGAFDGNGHVQSITLKRDGSWVAIVNGVTKRGSFYGPSKLPSNRVQGPSLVLLGKGLRLDVQVDKGATWLANDTLTVTWNKTTETLTAPWSSGDENKCDATKGAWGDDEVNADGLFCTCPAHEVYIPSLGGCVH